ncbi:class I SAM-dependent methyltransferase [Sphingobium sp. JS3065]|uniref:class I SAM-dependent methyltransferase n=1 Tax=Sphingobium sp. JS3065 TaxID=2970925 RepID=UPI002264992B|nr:class I SAM-dependent methyltransferase [Sphingobium sp. JS3065]UZW55098.1 class I SAM-dependent methyltransferase [Sphingobium sp. JS3065]
MDRSAYASMSAQEQDHWWFVARRAIIDSLIRANVPLPPGAHILEAGCGTGGNIPLLAQFGTLDAMEYDADARALASARGLCRVEPGALPDAIGFSDTRYDMIALLDVLEHIDQDEASLHALGARLAPNGRLLLTVPAAPWLWSDHDVLHHHKRRYTHEGLLQVVRAAELKVEVSGYFNSLLFPLAVAQRFAHHWLRRDAPLDARPSPLINAALQRVFAAERHVLGRIPFPVGLSLYAILSA